MSSGSGDLRDSLNRSKNHRGQLDRSGPRGSSSGSSLDRIKLDPRSSSNRPRLNEIRDLVSPASSGDEKDSNFLRKSVKSTVTAASLAIVPNSNAAPHDSGLSSEDHVSTGSSSGSSAAGVITNSSSHLTATNTTDNTHQTSNSTSSSHNNLQQNHSGKFRENENNRKHFKSSSSTSDKVRRSSTDSARSSNHHENDLDLIYKPSGSTSVAGADDVSDGSRPGTPLCDERQPPSGSSSGGGHNTIQARLASAAAAASTSGATGSSCSATTVRSSEPMSLPLPKFAHQLLGNQIHNHQSSSYLTVTKREKDPRLKSPSTSGSGSSGSGHGNNTTAGSGTGSSSSSSTAGSGVLNALSVSTCLKSPPPSLKSPGASLNNSSRIIPEHGSSTMCSDSGSNIPLGGNGSSSMKPHDPRLGTNKKLPNNTKSVSTTVVS